MLDQQSSSLLNLYIHNPLTYLTLADLHTYEVIILIIYGIMIICSFFTNLIAIIVFSCGSRSRSELSPFLLNLSVFNIIMTAYCIPFTITSVIFQRWLYARELCIVLDIFKTFSVSGVLLTLIIIAIDRYCAVKYPLVLKVYSTHKRNLIALLIIWILSIALAALWSPARSLPVHQKRLWVSSRRLLKDFTDAIENNSDSSSANYLAKDIHYQLVDTIQCVPNIAGRPVLVRRSILNFLQTYFFPLFILGFVYLRIAAMLWQRSNDGNTDLNRTLAISLSAHESLHFKKKLKQGIKMLIAVVALYAILWLPMNVFQLCLNLLCYPETKYQSFCTQPTLLQLLYIGSHFLTVSNTAINPIFYGFANNRFRSDIQQMKRRLLHCQRRTSVHKSSKYTRGPSQSLKVRPPDTQVNQKLLSANRDSINCQLGSSSSDKKQTKTTNPFTLSSKNPVRSSE